MARIARLVVPGHRHHVTQRGNRRMTVFFSDEDYALYLDLLAERCRKAGVEVWAYCLMPNRVHLILTPATPTAFGVAIDELVPTDAARPTLPQPCRRSPTSNATCQRSRQRRGAESTNADTGPLLGRRTLTLARPCVRSRRRFIYPVC